MAEEEANKEKKVDESWKSNVENQKQELPKEQGGHSDFIPPQASFVTFISSLSFQAIIALGEMDNPFSGKKEESLPQAKFVIDTLDMIKDKTLGNLSSDETGLLDNIIGELKMKFAAKSSGKEIK